LKRGWTKSWPLASALAACLAAWGPAAAAAAQSRGVGTRASRPSNELTVAGLRPGKDTLATAEKRFGIKAADAPVTDEGILLWSDSCTGKTLRVEVDEEGIIQSVTLSSLGEPNPDCIKAPAKRRSASRTQPLVTGHGLALGQPKTRVVELYGEAASELPATYRGREFELLFYAFDWAGSDVPQVMEVTCEHDTGQVRKITLAYPSL